MLVFQNDSGQVSRTDIRKPEEHEVAWIRLKQPSPADVREVLDEMFRCHPLLVEDAVKLNQRRMRFTSLMSWNGRCSGRKA